MTWHCGSIAAVSLRTCDLIAHCKPAHLCRISSCLGHREIWIYRAVCLVRVRIKRYEGEVPTIAIGFPAGLLDCTSKSLAWQTNENRWGEGKEKRKRKGSTGVVDDGQGWQRTSGPQQVRGSSSPTSSCVGLRWSRPFSRPNPQDFV